MAFRVLEHYPRRPHMEFFRRAPQAWYSFTYELDATRVRARAREAGASIYAAMVWAYHRGVLGIDAFRTRLVGEQVVLHDKLDVGMTVPAPQGTFSFANLPWDPDPVAWLTAARVEMDRASAAIDLSGGQAPDYAYYTALPKVPFIHFTHAPQADRMAGQPQIAFGRFREHDGRSHVPAAILINHLYVDGADLGELCSATADSFAQAF